MIYFKDLDYQEEVGAGVEISYEPLTQEVMRNCEGVIVRCFPIFKYILAVSAFV